MASVTASTLDTLLHLSGAVPDATLEEILDLAVDLINLYSRAGVPNMTGVAGSKTVSLESREKGAVLSVATAVYSNMYVSSGSQSSSYSVGGIGISTSNAASNAAVDLAVKEASRSLAEVEVDVG